MPDSPLPTAGAAEWFKAAVAQIENDPAADRASQPPSPTTADLTSRFPGLADVTVTPNDITTDGSSVPARMYLPKDRKLFAGFVWVHGGAFVCRGGIALRT